MQSWTWPTKKAETRRFPVKVISDHAQLLTGADFCHSEHLWLREDKQTCVASNSIGFTRAQLILFGLCSTPHITKLSKWYRISLEKWRKRAYDVGSLPPPAVSFTPTCTIHQATMLNDSPCMYTVCSAELNTNWWWTNAGLISLMYSTLPIILLFIIAPMKCLAVQDSFGETKSCITCWG